MTTPEIVRHADASALYDAAAADVSQLVQAAIAERGICHIALAGGRTPRGLYEVLATDPHIAWDKVIVLFGDERAVPPDDPASNFGMAREALFDRLPIPPTVLRMSGELPAADAARAYDAVVRVAEPLDVVLLGMGDDGHVASFFPGTPEPDADARVIATTSPLPPPSRVSLTLAAIRRSRAILLLVTGAGKAARLAEVWRQIADGAPRLPAARATSESGICRWHVDTAAAAQLPSASEELA
ncbi:MAG: 6-phosphogluconolactonase [Myxococcota bacterium]